MGTMTKGKAYPALQSWLRGLVDETKTETRDSIAAAGDIHPSNVSHWLRSGGRPGVHAALRIANHVGVSGIDVLEWCGYKDEATALRLELARLGKRPASEMRDHDCWRALGLEGLGPLSKEELVLISGFRILDGMDLSGVMLKNMNVLILAMRRRLQ